MGSEMCIRDSIIANHAKEGDGTLRSPEGVIVNKCDMLNFEGLKAFVGMI